MAKLERLPEKYIIDGFKGTIDFYEWKGIAVARKWPVFQPYPFSDAQKANQAAFAYINKLYSHLSISVIVGYTLLAARTTQTPKDYIVRAYMKGMFAIMPPEYYATEETQLAILALLDPEIAQILARLNAIKLTQKNLTLSARQGVIASGAAWTTFIDRTEKGLLHSLDISSDYQLLEFRTYIDGAHLIVPARTGTAANPLMPLRLNQVGGLCAHWVEALFDTVNNYFVIALRHPVQYNSSLKIQLRQQSGVNKNAVIAAYHRLIT